jgi:hypothetical protein
MTAGWRRGAIASAAVLAVALGACMSEADRPSYRGGSPSSDGGISPRSDAVAAADGVTGDAIRPMGGTFVDAAVSFNQDGRGAGTGGSGAGGAGGTGGAGGVPGRPDGGTADAPPTGPGGAGGGAGGRGGAGGGPLDAGGGVRDGALASDASAMPPFPDAASDSIPGPFPDGPPDGGPPATPDAAQPRPCAVELRAISASSLTRLVAGPTSMAVVRAELLNVPDPGNLRWTWMVTHLGTGSPLGVTADPGDPAVVSFRVERAGQYQISASTTAGGMQCGSGPVAAAAEDPRALRRLLLVRAIPPTSARLPVQHKVLEVAGGTPVVLEMRLEQGSDVTIDPRDQGTRDSIVSYVRVADLATPLVLEGYADQRAGFGAFLAPAEYQVVVIPTGADGAGVTAARHAPFILERATPQSIRAFPFQLTPGVPVRGRMTDARGGVVVDARVLLRGAGLASTVGRSGNDGSYQVLARTGSYGLTIAAPHGSGLPEVQMPGGGSVGPSIAIAEGAAAPAIDFEWDRLPDAELAVQVEDVQGRALPQARVRVQAQLPRVGVLTVTPPGGAPAPLAAPGEMRLDGETGGDGMARFGRVPLGSYQVLIAPSASAAGAVTTTTVAVAGGGAVTRTVRLARMARITGTLSGAGPLGGVRLVASDVGMDLSTTAVVAETGEDGSFNLPVSPRRRYLVLAHPPAGSRFARTFVGDGPLEASEFPIRQVLPARISFSGRVVSDLHRNGIPDTVIKVFCYPAAVDCPDPTVALAEGVSGGDGTFELALPDPSTR